MNDVHDLSNRLMNKDYDSLSSQQKHVIRHISRREHISRNVRAAREEQYTFGQRMADRVAAFGGSWPFIIIFFAILAAWIVLNSYILVQWKEQFDPYPYILLNLVLSMMAGIQAPIIMMSQNRQAQKDREDAAHDYEVNLKAELEIMSLHQKMDALRERQWEELMALQKEQLRMLTELMDRKHR